MKICYVVPALVNKAPILIVNILAAEMSRRGDEVTIIYFDSKVEIDVPDGVVIKHVGFLKSFDFSSFDVVHSHLLRSDLFVFKNKGLRSREVYVTTLHNYVEDQLAVYYSWFLSKFFSFVWNVAWTRHDCLVALSQHAVSYYSKFSYNKSLTKIYNGRSISVDASLVDQTYVEKIKSLKSKVNYVVGTYCVVTASKGIDLLVELTSLDNNAGLVVIGDGPERAKLEEMASTLGVSARCLFLDATPIAHQYNAFFDVYAMPSRSEGFGLSLIEAALHGKKIVCSDLPIFREIFNSSHVTYFKGGSTESLRFAVLASLLDDEKQNNAKDFAVEQYSSTVMGVNYRKLYIKLMKGVSL